MGEDVPLFTEPAPVEAAPLVEPAASAADVAPKRRRSGGRKRKAPAVASGTPDKAPRSRSGSRGPTKAQQRERIVTSVAAVHELAGGMVLPAVGRPGTGAAMRAQAMAAGEWWARVAERYPAVARLFAATGDGLLFVEGAMVYYPIIAAAMAEQRGETPPAPGAAGDPFAMLAGLAGMGTPPAAATDEAPPVADAA